MEILRFERRLWRRDVAGKRIASNLQLSALLLVTSGLSSHSFALLASTSILVIDTVGRDTSMRPQGCRGGGVKRVCAIGRHGSRGRVIAKLLGTNRVCRTVILSRIVSVVEASTPSFGRRLSVAVDSHGLCRSHRRSFSRRGSRRRDGSDLIVIVIDDYYLFGDAIFVELGPIWLLFAARRGREGCRGLVGGHCGMGDGGLGGRGGRECVGGGRLGARVVVGRQSRRHNGRSGCRIGDG